MRSLVSFVLAVLVMASSLMPCCVEDSCQDEVTSEQSSHDKSGKNDACSPFFACSTCAGFVQLSRLTVIPQLIEEPQTHHAQQHQLISSSYSPSLFQPPRAC